MIRTIIIDHDPDTGKLISGIIKNYFERVEIVDTVSDVESGRESILSHRPDLVFLDTKLPDGNSFEMLDCFAEINFNIIVLSEDHQASMGALQYHVFDYLIKPISSETLIKSLIKLVLKVEKDRVLLANNKHFRDGNNENNSLVLYTHDDIHVIKPNEILFCASEGSYTHFYLQNKTSILVSKNLKEFEQRLNGHHFIRVHHAFLVNMQHVVKYSRAGGGKILLNENTQIPVSVRKKADLLKLLEMMAQ